ncbi:MAG: ion transporter [Lachnospiraceae bacterium]|nr:ion transporter [Lachnospiraceae bacterium]
MRKKLFALLEVTDENNKTSLVYDFYDVIMMIVIVLSIIPLAFKEEIPLFVWIDKVAAGVFIIDYILRLFTADMKLKKGVKSFFLYPFTPMAIVDLLSILPSISVLNSGFRVLRITRLMRTLRIFRIFKVFRYSRHVAILVEVFKRQKDSLLAVVWLAIVYILISSLVVFNVEPDTFETFFDAFYWATVSLTTVGYGDIYPTSPAGQIVTMVSSVMGIAVVALPASIITAGYMEELDEGKKEKEN